MTTDLALFSLEPNALRRRHSSSSCHEARSHQPFQLLAKLRRQLRPHHVEQRDLAAQLGDETRMPGAILKIEALAGGAVQDRAQPADVLAPQARLVVDHEAGHHLGRAAPQYPALFFINSEA